MDKTTPRGVTVASLARADLLGLIADLPRRIIVHHGPWFAEVRHLMGPEKVPDILGAVFDNSFDTHIKRLGQGIGFELKKGLSSAPAQPPKDKLKDSVDVLCKN